MTKIKKPGLLGRRPANWKKPGGVTPNGYELEPAYREIGARLRFLRLLKNISQKRVGEGMDLSGAYIAQIEKGSTRLTVTDLLKLSRFFRVDPLKLIDGLTDESLSRPPEALAKKRQAAKRRRKVMNERRDDTGRLVGNKKG